MAIPSLTLTTQVVIWGMEVHKSTTFNSIKQGLSSFKISLYEMLARRQNKYYEKGKEICQLLNNTVVLRFNAVIFWRIAGLDLKLAWLQWKAAHISLSSSGCISLSSYTSHLILERTFLVLAELGLMHAPYKTNMSMENIQFFLPNIILMPFTEWKVKNPPLDSHTVTIYHGPITSSAEFSSLSSQIYLKKRLQTTKIKTQSPTSRCLEAQWFIPSIFITF